MTQLKYQSSLENLTDNELVASFGDLVTGERENLVGQLEILIEMDRRKLTYEYPSLWAYLIDEKGMEEATAERRIRAARLLKRFPELKAMLESGKMNLSLVDIALSCGYRENLSDPELLEVLKAISGMSCRKAKREIAERYPESVDIPKDRVRPIHSGFSEVTFYADEALMDKLEELRGLLAAAHPETGSVPMRELIKVLADDFYDRNHPESKARRAKERDEKRKTKEESPSALRVDYDRESDRTPKTPETPEPAQDIEIPARTYSNTLVHAMVQRDGYSCSYVDPVSGRKCQSTYNLNKDHIQSWYRGGKTSLVNGRFLCSHHHRRISYLEFGDVSKFQKNRNGKVSSGIRSRPSPYDNPNALS